ncbi:MAG: CotH kinase family protein [Steroidobacter sp.]
MLKNFFAGYFPTNDFLPRVSRLAITFLILILTGCGSGNGNNTNSNTASFTLQTGTTQVNTYPGGSSQVTLSVQGSGGFSGTVTVTPQLQSGITTIPASLSLASGQSGAFAFSVSPSVPGGDVVVNFKATAGNITASASSVLHVALENPDFVPATMDLPIVRINTENAAPIVSKVDYLNATIVIDPNGSISSYALSSTLKIRGRGNSSWDLMPKKPYKLKFDNKTSMLGMPADKEWALLANYSDKTLLRNTVAFELSRRLGMVYTPRSSFVEVFLNNHYIGTYLLCETIKIAKNRVNITALSDTDITDDVVSGGYLLEANFRLDEDTNWITNQNVPVSMHDPDPIAPQQLSYIQQYLQTTENSVYSGASEDDPDGYGQFIDVDSFINWFIVNELFKNNDANFWASVWMYKDRDKPLFIGPVWDFDIGAGNINYNGSDNPSGWRIHDGPWYGKLFADPVFAGKVKARWNAVKAAQIDTLGNYIDQNVTALTQSQQNNFQRWIILNSYVWPNSEIAGSYQGEVTFLKQWLQRRTAWMDAAINAQ